MRSETYLHIVASELEVRDPPVINLLCPLAPPFDSHVLLSRHELVDNQMLQSDLSSQLANPVHQVLPLAMDNFRNIVEVAFDLLVLPLHLVDLLLLDIKFVLLAAEVLMQIQLDVFLSNQLLL